MATSYVARASPLDSLARSASQTRRTPSTALAPPHGAGDGLSPISKAFVDDRSSYLTSGSRDLGVDRASYALSASEYDEEEADGGLWRQPSLQRSDLSQRSRSTSETHPFALDEVYEAQQDESFPAGSPLLTGPERNRTEPKQDAADSIGAAFLQTSHYTSERVHLPAVRPPLQTRTTPPLSIIIPPEPPAAHANPMSAPLRSVPATTPMPGGRVRSHTASGQIRNFSRPSTHESISPENSPPRPLRPGPHLQVAGEGSLQFGGPPKGLAAMRSANSAPNSPYVPATRSTPVHPAGFAFPPNTSPNVTAPGLTRGPSTASSNELMTPASANTGDWDPWRSAGSSGRVAHGPSRSLGQSETGSSEEDRRSSKSGKGSKWRFWSNRGKSVDHGNAFESPALAPSPLIRPPLSPAPTGTSLSAFGSPQLGVQRREDEEERLQDTPTAADNGLRAERVPSAMSYYSFHSVDSSQGEFAPQSPPMTSSAGHSSDGELSPGNGHAPHRLPGTSMQKAKASVNLLRPPQPNGQPATEPRRKKGELERPLSLDEPEDCLHLGISCHEDGELERSAMYFERAAKLKGGIGMGMLLWGLTLRHGWGCAVDPVKGFSYLQRAAESVVDDLDVLVSHAGGGLAATDLSAKAARSELVLAIYELGMSFRKGWGVKKDKKMALGYFELASQLGDPDAQQELGFAYLYGKGCKKDKAKAAHFYRLAARQGVQSFGQQWIWREKYGGTEP